LSNNLKFTFNFTKTLTILLLAAIATVRRATHTKYINTLRKQHAETGTLKQVVPTATVVVQRMKKVEEYELHSYDKFGLTQQLTLTVQRTVHG
jgi:4-hydroxy-3-methylbut-2-enyl diphosphate reductase IspH